MNTKIYIKKITLKTKGYIPVVEFLDIKEVYTGDFMSRYSYVKTLYRELNKLARAGTLGGRYIEIAIADRKAGSKGGRNWRFDWFINKIFPK